MTYPIAPYPAMSDPNVIVVQPFLKKEDIDWIRSIGDEYILKVGQEAKVGFHEESRVDRSLRSANSAWLPWPKEDSRIARLYDLMANVGQEANATWWQFNIWGFQDNLHYVRYDAEVGGHFTWHQDRGDNWRRLQRKLGIVLLLSDPSEFEGGDFMVFDGHETPVKPRERGMFYVFPSYTQHRVVPVTKGARRVLVGWLGGEKFR